MPSKKVILLVAFVAAIAGTATSVYFDPSIARRIGATEAGQRVIGAVLKARAPAPPAGLIVAERGDIVPNMTVADTRGAKVDLPKAWVGKLTLVNMWATWCSPCLKEMPELQAFAVEQGAKGVQVVGIALDDASAVNDFLQRHQIAYPVLVDAAGPADASIRLGNSSGVLPYTVLISADGRLLKTKIGPFEEKRDIEEWVKP